jgi:hypothetical protein
VHGPGLTNFFTVYGTVVFDLTLFNEVTQSDDILTNIRASVIDSCIEVIIGLPDIRVHRLIHRIPSYFDTPDPNYFELNTNMNGTTSTVRAATRPLSLIRADVVRTATNEYIDNEYIDNTRKVLTRFRAGQVTANPEKTELGLDEVEYVGHLISSTGTSFTDEKRLPVLDFSRSCSSHDKDGPASTEAY